MTPNERYMESLNEFTDDLDSKEKEVFSQVMLSSAMRKVCARIISVSMQRGQMMVNARLDSPEAIYDAAVSQGHVQGSISVIDQMVTLATQEEEDNE